MRDHKKKITACGGNCKILKTLFLFFLIYTFLLLEKGKELKKLFIEKCKEFIEKNG